MTDELRPYREYKNSALPWLGKVPKHWDVRRAKYLFRCIDIRSTTGEEELLTVSAERGVVPRNSMKVTMFKAESYIGHKLCWPNDLVINTLWAWGRGLGVTKHHGIISSAYGVYRLRPGFDEYTDFIHHLLRSAAFHWELRVRSKGVWISRLQLTDDAFLDAPILLPSPAEAEAIVRSIAAIQRRINRLILNRRRLIEVLNEQKQVIINRAVTRGLDSEVSLKPSGIDWLGDIPAHWRALKIKWIARINPSRSEAFHLREKDEPVVFLPMERVTARGEVHASESRPIKDVWQGFTYFRRGDVVVAKITPCFENGKGAWLGDLPTEIGFGTTEFIVLRPGPEVLPEYLYLLTHLVSFRQLGVQSMTGTAGQKRVPPDFVANFVVPISPLEEQREIIALVRGETAKFDAAIEEAQREIDLLCEYRTRLIADVVTGKVDVRQASATVATSAAADIKRAQPKRTANIYFRRSVFAAEIVHRLHDEPTFGHVKFEKLIFLCEKRCGVDTGSTYHRQAAGPYDNRALRSIDSQLKKQQWYEAAKGENGYRYVRLNKAGGHRKYFDRYFADVASPFDEIIATFRKSKTVQCEIVATLYAAWEDLLAENGDVTDDQIVEDVLHHWHPSKQQIEESRWRRELEWMRAKRLAPETGVKPCQ